MTIDLWLVFLAACVVFSLSPGAGMVSTINNSITGGFFTSIKGILGLQLAVIVHLLIVSIGLGALLATSAIFFEIVKYVGAAYLVFLGIMKFRESLSWNMSTSHSPLKSLEITKQAFLINMTNPKSIVFLAAFLPQFINPENSLVEQYLILGVTVVVIDSLVMLGYTCLGLFIKPYLTSERVMSTVNKGFGLSFIGMGVFLARTER